MLWLEDTNSSLTNYRAYLKRSPTVVAVDRLDMILDDNTVIEEFVRTFHGLAAVRNKQGKHLLINKSYEVMIGPVIDQSLTELISVSNSEIRRTTLNYCSHCDDEAFFRNQTTYHFEYFGKTKYITIRVPIYYQEGAALLILGNLYH